MKAELKPVFEMKILQCDGSIKVYNERPWWLDVPIQSIYPHAHHEQKKHEKISNTMSQIAHINREAYIDSLLNKGRVQRKGEKGIVKMHDVAGKLAR